MSVIVPYGQFYGGVCGNLLSTGKSQMATSMVSFSVQRNPSDPYFYADVRFKNMVVGSRYWIAQESDLTTTLASGVASASDFTVSSIPAYTNPMLLEIRVRYSSGATRYVPLKTNAYLVSSGVDVFIAQIEDLVAL